LLDRSTKKFTRCLNLHSTQYLKLYIWHNSEEAWFTQQLQSPYKINSFISFTQII
jgi:hypothetical protein